MIEEKVTFDEERAWMIRHRVHEIQDAAGNPVRILTDADFLEDEEEA